DLPAHPEPERLPGLDRDLVEDGLDAAALEDLPDEVVAPHAHAARRHHDVRALERGAERALERGRVVGRRLAPEDLGAGTASASGEVERVPLADLAGLRLLARAHELVARREEREAGPPERGHGLAADGGEHGHLDGREPDAAREHGFARAEVLAAMAHVLSGPRVVVERHAITLDAALLDHDDRVRSARELGPRRDLRALAGGDRPAEGRARARLADPAQEDRALARGEIRAPD